MAAERFQIFECGVCGIMTEVVRSGGGTMVCCGQEMTLHVENTKDAALEKHVPVVEKVAHGAAKGHGERFHVVN